MDLFPVLKTIHVFSAIAAVGTNLTYSVLLASATRQPDALVFTLNAIRILDRRLANPAYGLLLITGLSMALTVPFPLTTPWILSALVLYALVAVLGIAVYAPISRQRIRLAESEGLHGASYQATARKGNIAGSGVIAITVLIVILMVTKPVLWGG